MNNTDNPHHTATKYSCRFHYGIYADNTNEYAVGVNDNVTRVRLCAIGSPSWPNIDFEWPRQKFELERVERLMAEAYKRGVEDAKADIRSTLKEIIGI